jgi:hypothetical protein
LKPDRSRLGGVWTVNVHISTVANYYTSSRLTGLVAWIPRLPA